MMPYRSMNRREVMFGGITCSASLCFKPYSSIADERFLGCLSAHYNGNIIGSTTDYGSDRGDLQTVLNTILSSINAAFNVQIRFVTGLNTFLAQNKCLGSNNHYTLIADREMAYRSLDMRSGLTFLVVAHEVSHFLQYQSNEDLSRRLCAGSRVDTKALELMADFGAGMIIWQLAEDGLLPASENNRHNLSIVGALADLADYKFADPNHHGRVSERNNAFGFGRLAASKGLPLDMERLIKNKDTFLTHLPGPLQRTVRSSADMLDFYEAALRDIYR